MKTDLNEVICIKSEAFYSLIDEVIAHLDERYKLPKENQWIGTDEAMSVLQITSKTTLQKLRDEGKIRFSQNAKKIILYDRASLIKYIEKGVQEPF